MQTYISILRGINVSGHKKINMNELKSLFEKLGFKNIRTYIQSGNVIFDYNKSNPKEFIRQIEQKIFENYKFEVPVLIRTQAELRSVIDNNPFLREKGIATDKLYVTFLSDEADQIIIDKAIASNYTPDRFNVSGREVYVYCLDGYGRTKLSNTFFENKLKVKATTRNWKTVNTLSEMIDLSSII